MRRMMQRAPGPRKRHPRVKQCTPRSGDAARAFPCQCLPMRPLLLPALFAVCAAACAPPPPAAPASSPADVERERIHFVEDDVDRAAAQARAEGKALFVDAWAPWCHTCLSMKHFVLSDPSLAPLADRVVFASIDTDRPEAAPFLQRHAMKSWPTFFVIDPASDKVVGYWEGSASIREIRGLCEEALAGMRGAQTDPASRAFAEARAAHGAGDVAKAAASYERALAAAPPGWSSRGAALVGWIEALAAASNWPTCVRMGQAHAAEVDGSSAPGDFSATLLTCASKLPAGPEQTGAQKVAVARLREVTAHPPADASADDRQDAFASLAEGLEALGDAAGARHAQEARAALLEQAARAAKTPEQAQAFDYARAGAYTALGRGDEAVAMLSARERELPGSYEPPARLAGVLFRLGRLPEALAAVDRAIARAYGPRKMRYLELRGDILEKQGDLAGALAARRDEVKGLEGLPPGQARPADLADARQRLAGAEKAAQR